MATRSRRGCWSTVGVCVGLAVLVAPPAAGAKERLPGNLGNGLARLVAPPPAPATGLGRGPRLNQSRLAIRDSLGRVLVDVRLAPGADLATVQQRVQALGLQTTTKDATYRTGLIEGFVAVDKVAAVARTAGVGAVLQALPARTRVGAVTSQGVHEERIDRLPRGVDGSGLTIGVQSDSYDAATTDAFGDPLTDHAADDVASGDLPGPGNPLNAQPVVVLNDLEKGDPIATDEGRGILQIVHDIAPKSKLCFASAFLSEAQFAQNIRDLADPAKGCGADIVDDDVGYFDEPMFEDGEVADAVNDVAAKGVHYFSSAGNSGDDQGYDAAFSPVDPKSADVAKAGLDLSGVDPSLYAGGFQDFDPGPGVDVAQDTSIFGEGIMILQWDDPFDATGPQLGDSLLDETGAIPDDGTPATFTVHGTAGQDVFFKADYTDPAQSGNDSTGVLVLTVRRPDGTVLQRQTVEESPQQFAAHLPVTGDYTVEVEGSPGAIAVTANLIVGGTQVSTDYNLLFFDEAGHFVGSSNDNNPLSGRPIEIADITAEGDHVQVVIARGSAPATGAPAAQRLRYLMIGPWQIEEFRQPLAPTIQGHPAARGATAVGAYNVFTPEEPEDFTSAGGDLPFPFDANGNRLASPDIRRKPEISATDGVNTTFFFADTIRDADTFPNFFGTSASAPAAAAIGALVLQRRGGAHSLSPEALRALLERSTFPHDLDPYAATARSRGGVSIDAVAEEGEEFAGGPTESQRDPRVFTVRYDGPGSIVNLTLDASKADPSGLEPGLAWDPRPFDPDAPEASGSPFAVGAASPGIDPESVTATFAKPAPRPAVDGQFSRMTVRFAPGSLTAGRFVSFGVDRDEVLSAFGDSEEGNSADLLSDAVSTPADKVLRGSVRFTATLSNGRKVDGEFANRLGFGFSPLDGFGLLDAVRAVGAGAPRRGNGGDGGHRPSRADARRAQRARRDRAH